MWYVTHYCFYYLDVGSGDIWRVWQDCMVAKSEMLPDALDRIAEPIQPPPIAGRAMMAIEERMMAIYGRELSHA